MIMKMLCPLYIQMEETFCEVEVFLRLLTYVVLCFVSARGSASSIVQIVGLLMVRRSLKVPTVSRYLCGRTSLNLIVNRESAVDYLTRQVPDSALSAQAAVKRVAFDIIEPFSYQLLKNSIPPAVFIMVSADNSENKAVQKLSQDLADGASIFNDQELLNIQ